jgi:hypothetical protein
LSGLASEILKNLKKVVHRGKIGHHPQASAKPD